MEETNSVLSGEGVFSALCDAYPSLRNWRDFRIGLSAIIIEALAWLACLFEYSSLGLDVAHRAPQLVVRHVQDVTVYALLASVPIAFVGILFDKRKIPSVIVLASIFPLLTFLGMWEGYW